MQAGNSRNRESPPAALWTRHALARICTIARPSGDTCKSKDGENTVQREAILGEALKLHTGTQG